MTITRHREKPKNNNTAARIMLVCYEETRNDSEKNRKKKQGADEKRNKGLPVQGNGGDDVKQWRRLVRLRETARRRQRRTVFVFGKYFLNK